MNEIDGLDELDDATVVRPAPVDDATIVRPRRADDAPVDDATIVRPKPAAGDDGDHGADGEAEDRTVARSARHGVTASVALPVEDDDTVSGRSLSVTTVPALDPERRIAAVPGRAPWEAEPVPERGVRPGAPVVYGARSEHGGDLPLGPDAVHERLGDAPPATPVHVREARAALPSMERRAQRSRVGTLVGYGAVVLVAIAGLWVVATLAFG